MKEQVSALMDDELDVDASGHLLTALNKDNKLCECWATYHMIGDSLRGASHLNPDFHQRLMQRLENEPTVLAPRRKSYKPPLMLSAAASVAAVAFVGWIALQQQTQAPTPAAPVLAQNNISPESVKSYLLAHQELSPENNMHAAYYVHPVAYAGNGN